MIPRDTRPTPEGYHLWPMHQQLQWIVDGYKAQKAAHAVAPKPVSAPVPAPAPTLAELHQRLAREKVDFDPLYAYSDDYSFYTRQRAKEQIIQGLRAQIAKLEALNLKESDQ